MNNYFPGINLNKRLTKYIILIILLVAYLHCSGQDRILSLNSPLVDSLIISFQHETYEDLSIGDRRVLSRLPYIVTVNLISLRDTIELKIGWDFLIGEDIINSAKLACYEIDTISCLIIAPVLSGIISIPDEVWRSFFKEKFPLQYSDIYEPTYVTFLINGRPETMKRINTTIVLTDYDSWTIKIAGGRVIEKRIHSIDKEKQRVYHFK